MEFIPPRDTNNVITLPMLDASLDTNIYPNVHVLRDGTVFVFGEHENAVYNPETFEEIKRLPPQPGTRSYPHSTSVFVTGYYPPLYDVEFVACGGGTGYTPLSPALSSCISIDPMDDNPVWMVEMMVNAKINLISHLRPNTLPYSILIFLNHTKSPVQDLWGKQSHSLTARSLYFMELGPGGQVSKLVLIRFILSYFTIHLSLIINA